MLFYCTLRHKNIVGYTTQTLADDSQAIASSFVEVSGDAINLTTIKPSVDGSCNGDIYIEMLDSLGRTSATYYWYQNSRGKDDGWYNDDDELIGEDADDVPFAPGVGLWLTGIAGELLTTAGQVFTDDLEITLLDDSQMLGNPFATTINLAANISVEADGACNGDIYIEMLDSLGRTSTTYYWYQNSRGKEDGWYNDDDELIGEDADDIPFAAGTGLWVCGIEDAKFKIVSPLK